MIVKHINGKEKNLKTEEMVDNFLLTFENGKDKEIKEFFMRAFFKGTTVYYAYNPYMAEIHNRKEIIFGTVEREVKSTFNTLGEEV